MLQFAGGVGFGMDIGGLFHLERAFHAGREVETAADEEDVVGVRELGGEPLQTFFVVEDPLDLFRQGLQFLDERGGLLLGQLPSHPRELDGQQVVGDELGGIRLGGRDGDLRAGERVEHIVRFAGDGAADDIDDGQGLHVVRLAFAQGFEAVGRLTGLADDDREGIRGDRASAVPELGSDFHADRDAGQVLEHILGDHADVVGGAAADDEDVVDRLDVLRGQAGRGEIDLVLVVRDGVDGILHCLRLFVDLLHHEVLKAAAFGCLSIPGDLGQRLDERLAVDVVELDAALLQAGHLHIIDVINFSGMVQDGRDVGGDERFLPFFADDHRAAVAGAEDLAGVVREHEAQRVGAAHTQDGAGDGAQRALAILFIIVVDQFDDTLGVGLGVELVSVPLELVADLLIVLDDAVVDTDDRVVIRMVRVRVGLRGRAVGRPAGMADAAGTDDGLYRSDLFLEVGDPPLLLHGDGSRVSIAHGDAGRVIATVFEFGQAFQQNGSRLFLTDISYDSTHSEPPVNIEKASLFKRRLCRLN